MGTLLKFRKGISCLFIGLVLVNLLVLVNCRADKDTNLLLEPPGSNSGPLFSSSIDSIPVSASSNRQSHIKSPSYSHSSVSAVAAASAGGHGHGGEQNEGGSWGGGGGGGRNNKNNSPWYNSNGNSGYSFEVNEGSSVGNQLPSSLAGAGNGYYEQLPTAGTHQVVSTANAESNGPPNGGAHGPSYTYFYQHYPSSSNQMGWGGGGGDDSGHGNLFGDLSIPGIGGGGLGLGGVGGVKVVKIAAAIVKGIIAAKPILLIALLALISLPILLFLAPIPIITITQQPSIFRSARSSSQQLTSYLSTLSERVLKAEECLERVICKLPQPPEKFRKKTKSLWEEHGSKLVANERVVRGLNAYFDTSSLKNRNLKCNQRFKCSNKYL